MTDTERAENETTEAVYRYIETCILQRHYPPSYREIAEAVFISSGSVLRHLDRLEMMGRIARVPGMARGISLLSDEDEA